MKKILAIAAAAVLTVCALSACSPQTDYTGYISEMRSEIYLYKDDETDLKIYCVRREQPYNADGICGDMCDLIEIYAQFANSCESVEISLFDYFGEMSYQAVDRQFFSSYSAPAFLSDGVDVTLNIDGNTKSVRALNVLDSGVISCERALDCVMEHDRELFEALTSNGSFAGEIYIRLLYDEGCYYYVGVCDREKNITAYLLDGGIGKVIATKKLKG